MGCVNADGTLVASAQALIEALAEPQTAEQVAPAVGQPLFKVRAGLRELAQAGLIEANGESYRLTETGRARLKK